MQKIKIVEVAPRDGLQNEAVTVPTEAKGQFVDALSDTGVSEIEVSAFVSPKWVPQLGDAEDLFHRITRKGGVIYSALVPNERGLDRAIRCRVDKVSVFTAVSETFNRKNINTSVEGSIRRFKPLVQGALNVGLPVRGYVSTAFWCAFEGKMAPKAVVRVVERLFEIGVDEVSVSDTIGKASPQEVETLLEHLLPIIPVERVAMHFHDTYGNGVANVLASRAFGVGIFDASAGGLGGCPFAPGATGNVSTESVVSALEAQGEVIGVDLLKLKRAGRVLDPYLAPKRQTMPPADSLACTLCEFARGDDCCEWDEANPTTNK
jgi:hydroxymethylglutaryl-CoA lyase